MPSEGDSTALRLSRILAACPTLRKYYWPTLLLHTPLLQFVVLAFKEARARLLPSPYTDRKIISMLDGERVACDWMEPPVIRDDAPAVVLLTALSRTRRVQRWLISFRLLRAVAARSSL